MGTPTKHPQTIVLDHCWICLARFLGDGGTEPREDHHVIPEAYGGRDGPTVTLCDSHHTKLHKIAVALKAKKSAYPLLTGECSTHREKLMYLANQVYNAELQTRNDPNKAASVALTLKAAHKNMVDQLRPIYPAAKSREALILIAIEALHRRHFVS